MSSESAQGICWRCKAVKDPTWAFCPHCAARLLAACRREQNSNHGSRQASMSFRALAQAPEWITVVGEKSSKRVTTEWSGKVSPFTTTPRIRYGSA